MTQEGISPEVPVPETPSVSIEEQQRIRASGRVRAAVNNFMIAAPVDKDNEFRKGYS